MTAKNDKNVLHKNAYAWISDCKKLIKILCPKMCMLGFLTMTVRYDPNWLIHTLLGWNSWESMLRGCAGCCCRLESWEVTTSAFTNKLRKMHSKRLIREIITSFNDTQHLNSNCKKLCIFLVELKLQWNSVIARADSPGTFSRYCRVLVIPKWRIYQGKQREIILAPAPSTSAFF